MTLRQDKVNSLIQEELGGVINRELELPDGCLITISGADVSADLKHTKIYISVLPEKYRGTVLELLRKNTKNIQFALNKRLAMKFFPKIHWLIDATEEKAMGIDALLDKIKEEL